MVKEICEVCGHDSLPESLVTNFIVPQDITKQAGLPCPRTVTLCVNCSNELRGWYAKKVSSISYAFETRRFGPKSPNNMVNEYENAYAAFIEYKKRTKGVV